MLKTTTTIWGNSLRGIHVFSRPRSSKREGHKLQNEAFPTLAAKAEASSPPQGQEALH